MWNSPGNPIPRSHIIRDAFEHLERVRLCVLEEEYPMDFRSALRVLTDKGSLPDHHARQFEALMTSESLDPCRRAVALDYCLRHIRSALGNQLR